MDRIKFGRRCLLFQNGAAVLTSTSVTERARRGEDERAFTKRLLETFCEEEGTIEIVFKAGRPDYAIVTIKPTG
jgi:hypothetical protein